MLWESNPWNFEHSRQTAYIRLIDKIGAQEDWWSERNEQYSEESIKIKEAL